MDVSLDDLASYFKPLAQKLLDDSNRNGVPVRVVDTLRTPDQQEQAIALKRSWTQHSKHLPQPPENKSEAIDVVPLAILALGTPNWAPEHPLWDKLGAIGKTIGLTWGGDWKASERDPSHFEYKKENV